MALPEVTYADYEAFGGAVSEERFPLLLHHAIAAVREIIGFNVPETEAEITAYKNAVCAAVDVDEMHGGTGGLGEGGSGVTIGSYSASYTSSSSASRRGGYDDDMRRAIKGWLVGTRLLYQVIK